MDAPAWGSTAKAIVTVVALGVMWGWESILPRVAPLGGRWRHALRNGSLALGNTLVLALLLGAATFGVAEWTAARGWGLLSHVSPGDPWRMLAAVLVLDLWLYGWHRLNHALPLLWRFHRVHHADARVDVTTATRFHVGEHLAGAVLRLGLIPLLGLRVLDLLVFETLVVAHTMFHHANISLGRVDPLLRWLIVTPRMHEVHHSRQRVETDSNYATLFSFWDRLFGSYRTRPGSEPIALGLEEFDDDRWQTVGGMLLVPFVSASSDAPPPPASEEPANADVKDVRDPQPPRPMATASR